MPRGVYKRTKKTKRKIKENHARYWLGKKRSHTEKTRKKMSKAHKGMKKPWVGKTGKRYGFNTRFKKGHKPYIISGERNHLWKGGISNYIYPVGWTEILRESIRIRDNYICQECGIHQDELVRWLKKLDVHHIDYDKNNLNPDNLITLCRSCHIKTNSNRDYWIKYFN